MSEEAIWAWLQHPPPKCCHGLLGVPRACHSLGIPSTGHATPSPCCHRPSGCVHARALAACPQGPSCLRPGACQSAHASMPWPWLRALALAAACMPWPWLRALGLGCCMHAQALAAACPWGAALALAAACPGLGCLPMGAALALAAACPCLDCVPMGGCLGLGCCMSWACQHAHGGLLGRHWASQGHARVHAAPHRPASSRTPAKFGRAFFHFCFPKFIP